MQITDFGLKFSELRTADIEQVPNKTFTLYAHGTPWYVVTKYSFGIVISRSAPMVALMISQTHPLSLASKSTSKVIVDSCATGEDLIKLLRKVFSQRMPAKEHELLLSAIDYWLETVEEASQS